MRPVPRLVLAVGNDPVTPSAEPKHALDPQTARYIQAILVDTLAIAQPNSTWANAGGRAGAAQSGRPGAPPHAWFIGLAPRDQPRYAVAVIVEHGEDGWQVAAPIGIQILAQAITQ